MSFKVMDFWPQPKPGEVISFQYDGPVSLRSDFRQPQSGFFTLDDFQDGQWHDQWQLVYDTPRGVLEVGDLEKLEGWEAVIWGDRKQITYQVFKEIIWGNIQNVGDVIQAPIAIDRYRSTGAGALIDNAGLYGYQVVVFEALEDDVLQYAYAQAWGNKVYGARYFAKKGVGPIGIEWRKPDGTFTSRINAVVTNA